MRLSDSILVFLSAGLLALPGACGSGGSSSKATGGGGGSGGTTGSSSSSSSSGHGGGGAITTSTSGSTSTSSGATDAGAPCPIYQALCNGTCIPTSQDPQNCGGCGVTCGTGQVCSGGGCASSCLPGTTPCNGACVDIQDDDANCGGCSMPCPTGKGCVQGQCITSLGGSTTSACTGNGPPIDLGGMTAGCVAQTTFTWGLCSCTNVGTSGNLLIDGYDSTKGPYVPGGLGAGLGINNQLQASTQIDVWGPMWTYSTSGLGTSATLDIKQDTRLNGPIQSSSALTFEKDLYVNGGIATSGSVAVTGTLTVPSSAVLNGNITHGQLVLAPVSVSEPCDCSPSSLLPIASWVAAAKAKNDDQSIALDPDALVNISTPQRLDLPCGVYYLSKIATSAPLTIAAHGNTALFIEGDVATSQPISFVLDPTAQFDVVVGGTIGSSAPIVIGSPNYPALSRTYIGSTSGLNFSGPLQLGGNLYVGYGPLGFSSSYTMYGAVFAKDVHFSQDMSIHFDRGVVGGGLCGGNPPPSSSSSSSSGGSACTSCKQCGDQACVNGACGACGSDGDCCAPLSCIGGTCVLLK